MKKVIIIGAGPAGLTAGFELLKRSKDYEVVILEESDKFGGISRTVNYKGNRMDMGGHRFFSKDPDVNRWWNEMLPVQGSPSMDDIKLGRTPILEEGGPDPEKTDRVMLKRNRLSRIFFKQKFFDYPISFKPETFINMGFGTTIVAGFSYLKSMIVKLPEDNLENFYINRFGRKLYSMFFERYTENLWGRHPSEISAEWGAQRVKGLSIMAILKDMFGKVFHVKNRKVETSLIEVFSYPKLGPGEMWDLTAEEIRQMGGTIIQNARVTRIHKDENNSLTGVSYEKDGKEVEINGDYVISSMPIKDLVAGMNDVPEDMRMIAEGLPYRDYKTVGVLVKHLELPNKTKIPTLGNIVPDNWVYVHDTNVDMGRFQIYNNWSPYLVKDVENTTWIGLEYFCNEGDEMWTMSDEDFAHKGIKEMITMKMISSEEDVLDYHVEFVKKAYPAYFDTYDHIDDLRDYLNTIPNLFCVGRNGQHRYNNLDHSMVTSFETVKNIMNGTTDKTNIWNVNTEKEYHEESK